MSKLHLAVQEQMVPGMSLEEKFETVTKLGYEALELRGGPGFALEKRLDELRIAKAAGVIMPTDCVDMTHFIGAFNADRRANAVLNLKSQLSVMAEIGGEGAYVATPAAWGMFSRRLPPHEPPRDQAGDIAVLVEGLNELGAHAQKVGAYLLIEPLNRYEDHMVNTIGTAMWLTDQVDAGNRDGLGVVLDTYHMGIEEADPPGEDTFPLSQSVIRAGSAIRHVQLGDSDRHQPGTGHLDWQRVLRSLRAIHYDGYMALECRLIDPSLDPVEARNSLITRPSLTDEVALAALRQGARFMQEQWEKAGIRLT